MEMSAARVLKEIKVLDKRITELNQELRVVGIRVNGKLLNSPQSIEEFNKSARAMKQKIEDLIKQRKVLKAALIKSNAETLVKIGSLEEITVAQALEYKDSINLEHGYAQALRRNYHDQSLLVAKHNKAVEEDMHKNAVGVLARGTDKDSSEYKAFCKAFMEAHEAFIVDPIDVPKEVERYTEYLTEFEKEVDICLSESNARTVIEV